MSMITEDTWKQTREAARELLDGEPFTVDGLATLLIATHLTGAAGGLRSVAGLSAARTHAFADELEKTVNEITEEDS